MRTTFAMTALLLGACGPRTKGAVGPRGGDSDDGISEEDSGSDGSGGGDVEAELMYGGGSCTLRAMDASGGLISESTLPGLLEEDLAEMIYTTELSPSPYFPTACFLRWEDDYMFVLAQLELWDPEQVPDCQVPDRCQHMTLDVKYRSSASSDTGPEQPDLFDQVDVNMAETNYVAWAESTPSLSSASPYDAEHLTEGWAHFASPAQALGDVEGPGGELVTREPEQMAAMLPLVEETWPGLDHFELSWSLDPEVKWTAEPDTAGE